MGWIWENTEWPNFRWNSAQIAVLLGQAHEAIGRLGGTIRALGMDAEKQAMLRSMVEDVIRSSEIEGVILNGDQVRSSVAWRLGLPDQGLPPSSHYIEGLVNVMIDACQNCDEPLTESRLFEWHTALFPKSGGAYRCGSAPMRIISGVLGDETVHYDAPPSERVPEEMKRFLEWLHQELDIDPLIKAAIASYWFVAIHPFGDGNGRLSRTIMDMMQARCDRFHQRLYSMYAEIENRRSSYYQILAATSCGDLDITRWLEWYLNCLLNAIKTSEQEIEKALVKTNFWKKYESVAFCDRHRKVLNRFIEGFEGKLTTSNYAKLAKCSNDTALRDLQFLCSEGVLRVEGNGRGSHYVLAAGVPHVPS